MIRKGIYLDHGASTPVDQAVIEAMLPYWTTHYGNSGAYHAFGRESLRGLERARTDIARLLGAKEKEIIFTGGGSESDNLALRGVMVAARKEGKGNHLIVSAIEHPAVLKTAEQLRDLYQFELTIVGVDEVGRVSPQAVAAAMRADTVLVSIMAANNEIGTVQPIVEIGKIVQAHGALFHTDAIQAVANYSWNLQQMPIDLLTIAPHKFYGPKGVGILYFRDGISLIPNVTGGAQEEGYRAGTVNVPLAVGAAKALQLAMAKQEEDSAHYIKLRTMLIEEILSRFGDQVQLTGCSENRLPHHASFAFKHINGNDLIIHLDVAGVAASSGSACATGNPKPAAVLEAIGLSPEWTMGGLRFTVGRRTEESEIVYAVKALEKVIRQLQQLKRLG